MSPYLVHQLFYDVVEIDTSSVRLDRFMLVTIGVKVSPRLPHFTLFQCGAQAWKKSKNSHSEYSSD